VELLAVPTSRSIFPHLFFIFAIPWLNSLSLPNSKSSEDRLEASPDSQKSLKSLPKSLGLCLSTDDSCHLLRRIAPDQDPRTNKYLLDGTAY
jgi:hypothetical protein